MRPPSLLKTSNVPFLSFVFQKQIFHVPSEIARCWFLNYTHCIVKNQMDPVFTASFSNQFLPVWFVRITGVNCSKVWFIAFKKKSTLHGTDIYWKHNYIFLVMSQVCKYCWTKPFLRNVKDVFTLAISAPRNCLRVSGPRGRGTLPTWILTSWGRREECMPWLWQKALAKGAL